MVEILESGFYETKPAFDFENRYSGWCIQW